MNTFITYALQANLALLFFFFMEAVFFRNEKSFTMRRFFLLLGMPIALAVPLLKHLLPSLPIESLTFAAVLAPVTVGNSVDTEVLSFAKIVSSLYFVGVAFFSLHLLKQFFQLFRVLSKRYHRWNGLRVYESENPHHVFSFFRFVSISNSEQFSSWERTKILRHELVHAQQLHSIDILLISLIQILFWFNPLLYFYKQKLIQLHEFEADARSVKSDEVDLYCNLLARVALQSSGLTLANHFIQSVTLNRILMMKSVNKKMSIWKIAMTVACTTLFLVVMSAYKPAQAQEKNTPEKVQTTVDDMPSFPGGYEKLGEAIGKVLTYPAEARKKGIQGKTLVQFVVEADGSLSSFEVKKGFDKECDAEAVRALKSLNAKWNPGKQSGKAVRTQMIMPIQFKL